MKWICHQYASDGAQAERTPQWRVRQVESKGGCPAAETPSIQDIDDRIYTHQNQAGGNHFYEQRASIDVLIRHLGWGDPPGCSEDQPTSEERYKEGYGDLQQEIRAEYTWKIQQQCENPNPT
jgi:hypothetical protein